MLIVFPVKITVTTVTSLTTGTAPIVRNAFVVQAMCKINSLSASSCECFCIYLIP